MRSAILIPVLAIATLAPAQVQIPPNGAEEQSKNVVFNLKINPDPEAWATGTNCEMNAEARADSQPRWIQYVPYTGSEPWTSWKITEFKITLGDTIVWTGESAENEGAPRIIKAIRYASTHFPNGKATFKVSAKFVFYRNGVQGEVRELSATTQVRVYNKLFAWSTWWTSDGICGNPADAAEFWDVLQTPAGWIPKNREEQLKEAQNQSLYRELACGKFVENLLSANYIFSTDFTGDPTNYLYCRTKPGPGTPDALLLSDKFDEGVKLATVFLSLGHGASVDTGTKALVTSRNLEYVSASSGPISIKAIVGLRDSTSTSPELAPRPQFAALYSCFSTENLQYLDPFRIQLSSELVSPDRALVGFNQDIGVLTVGITPAGRAFAVPGQSIDAHVGKLAEMLRDGKPLYQAVQAADTFAPRRYVSNQQPATMTILNDPVYRMCNVYLFPLEYAIPERIAYFNNWYMPL